ncbi:TPA: hypothetical protein ACVU4L_001935 [Vibrio parahaemolyticus]
MGVNKALTVALITKDGQTLELETKRGSQGHIIELTEVIAGGQLKKSFHPATPKPIPSDIIFEMFKTVVNAYIKEGSIIIDSTMPFKFDNNVDKPNYPLTTDMDACNEVELKERFNNADFAVQVVPAYGVDALVSFDADAQYAISVMSPAGIPICVNQRNMAVLCKINQYLEGRKLVVNVELGVDGSVYIKDIYYDGCDRTKHNLADRIEYLNQIFDREIPYTYVVNPLVTKEEKLFAFKSCEVTGNEIVLVHKGHVRDSNQITRVKHKMDLKNETTLQVMTVCKVTNTVTLCAYVDGIPIELGKANNSQEIDIEELDTVRVKFSSAATGEIKNIEIISKLEGDEPVLLDPVLARKLGFNLHPKSITERELYSSEEIGFLDKLEQCED